jgi:hypothetical protein
MPETFVIIHPEHGEAICEEYQFPEFEAAGWTKKDEKLAQKSGKKT